MVVLIRRPRWGGLAPRWPAAYEGEAEEDQRVTRKSARRLRGAWTGRPAEKSLEGHGEEIGPLGHAGPREVHLGAAFGGVVGRIEPGRDHEALRSGPDEEALAPALISQVRDDDVEAGRICLADIGEARLLADHLEPNSAARPSRAILHVAEHGVPVLRLVLGQRGRREESGTEGQGNGEGQSPAKEASVAARFVRTG